MKSRTGIIFLALFIVLIAIFKVSLIVGWSKTAGLLMGLFILVYGNYITIAFSLWIRINLRHHETIESQGESVLIVAPHQDDGVAIAGGFAIQTIQNGGRVDVLFMTDGPRTDKKTRRKEAIEAWTHGGLLETALHFLPFDTGSAFVDRDEIEDGVQQFSEHMQKIKPDFLFIPLYEGGHFQHDVVNYIVRRSLNETRSERIRVYEAPVYNFYYSWRTTPEKILSGLTRFIPFFRYLYPPEPVREADYFQLKMSPEQLKLKKHMLARFKTQNPGKLVERFGFEDRYQAFHDYDYSIPPFDYTRSLAKRLDNWKRFPVLGKIVSRMFKWTRTIHPDPDYTITNIPLHLKGQ